MNPYKPLTVADGPARRRLWSQHPVLAFFAAGLAFISPFCLSVLAAVQRLGPMSMSDAFHGFGAWHLPSRLAGWVLLAPSLFAGCIAFQLVRSQHGHARRLLSATLCLTLVFAYLYWIAFYFGFPVGVSNKQWLDNSVYALIATGFPALLVCTYSRLRKSHQNERSSND